MTVRYVVLHHTGHGPEHYDLMVATDADGPLHTWRLPAWPPDTAAVAEPLPPHRRAYLTYEGGVTGDRGRVRRVAEGLAELATGADGRLSLRLSDQCLRLDGR